MSIELKVPEVGESVSEVQIGDWSCQSGDLVERDQTIVAIDTDKVTLEITAPTRGRLVRIILEKGASARVGDVVGLFESEQAPRVESLPLAESQLDGETLGTAPQTERQAVTSVGRVQSADSSELHVESSAATPWASPSARRALAEKGLSGGGPLLKQDVARHLEESLSTKGSETVATGPEPAEKVVKMSPLRQRVAARLLEAQQTMALLTTFNEIDMHAVQQLRQEVKEEFFSKYGVKLGLMSFFVRAGVEALKAYPVVNAEVRGSDLVYKHHYDIGIAIGGGRGLVVPVLRNVERLGFAAIERAIAEFAARAKDNKLELRELSGGTFTITNGGVYGSMLSTPIVNPPQSAILGLHAITDRPVALNGAVVIRPMMYVALTYDHRVIDGREAVGFLRTVKGLVENPIRMLLEI